MASRESLRMRQFRPQTLKRHLVFSFFTGAARLDDLVRFAVLLNFGLAKLEAEPTAIHRPDVPALKISPSMGELMKMGSLVSSLVPISHNFSWFIASFLSEIAHERHYNRGEKKPIKHRLSFHFSLVLLEPLAVWKTIRQLTAHHVVSTLPIECPA